MTNVIMAVLIDKRSTAAPMVQEILTKYGHIIYLRLGFHELHHGDTNEVGQILLQLCGTVDQVGQLQAELSALDLVKVKSMSLD